MLTKDPAKRINGQDALQHPWFKKLTSNKSGSEAKLTNVVIRSDVLQRLQSFKGVTTF